MCLYAYMVVFDLFLFSCPGLGALIAFGPKGGGGSLERLGRSQENHERQKPHMTYTFKLSRRLAASPTSTFFTALVLLAACAGEPTAPDVPGVPDFPVAPVSSSQSSDPAPELARHSHQPTVGRGIPFGAFGLRSASSKVPFTLSQDGYSASTIIHLIDEARSNRIRIHMALAGGSHDNYKTGGRFDLAKWRAKMNTYNTPAIRAAIAGGVADGTVVGNIVMDEPHNTSPNNSWGPAGTVTKGMVDEMCGYVQAMFPTLAVGVTHDASKFEPSTNYQKCDYIVSQYRERKGTVTSFRDQGLAFAKRSNVKVIFSLNILDGGYQISGCPSSRTGGYGTYRPNCRMTPAQVEEYARVLGPAGCALLMWRYDDAFMAKAANQAAFRNVAAMLAAHESQGCRRGR